MKSNLKIVSFILAFMMLVPFTACTNGTSSEEPSQEVVDNAVDLNSLSDYEFATRMVSSVDALGRITLAGGGEEAKDVGLFYFLWLGAHASGSKIYNVSELEKNNPNALWSHSSPDSPAGVYHFWGEPLYGYYDSADPWVITRHVELFTMIGVDYILFDTTNAITYDNVVKTMLPILDKYQKQGWDVPQIGFMTNTHSRDTVLNIYNTYYKKSTSTCYYPDLWYSPNGKPFIIGNKVEFNRNNATDKEMLDFFQMRDAQWPNAGYIDKDAFPWMDWSYPQTNHNGTVSVSIAQHITCKMSLKDQNWGRSYDQYSAQNFGDYEWGTNFQDQWYTVLYPEDDYGDVDNVFVTGWNEWIAIKFYDDANGVYFVDQFDEDYSRDIEMMKGGYGDNFYLQLFNNIREFKYESPVRYAMDKVGGNSEIDWQKVRSYPDFVGDAMNRNFKNYLGNATLTDTTARNDISSVKITYDDKNVYFRIETAKAITDYKAGDKSFMNVWISTSKSGEGFDYVINRDYARLSKISGGQYTDAGSLDVNVSGNVMTIRLPMSSINQSGTPAFRFKVSDNVDASDVMNFYIQGDSAPIGRLTYTYGYMA